MSYFVFFCCLFICMRGYPEVRGQIEYLFYLSLHINETFTS